VKLTDGELAHFLAEETGKRLMAVRERLYNEGASTWYAKDVGDAVAQRFIDETLAEHRPHDAVLSEEAADDSNRITADRVWIIDPLDGTQEYSEFDRADWAVHIALWERKDADGKPTDDGSITQAAVALPAYNMTLSTHQLPKTPVKHEGKPRLVVSRNRATREAVIVAEALDCDVARLGSAGAKAMAVVLGEVDIYVHAGGMYQWDSAAPIAVAAAAGLFTSRIDGTPLIYNRRDAWLPDLVVCQQHLAQQVIDALRAGRLGA
jgi:3'(2'), 5'-bisphosphate nucleotidase